MPRKASVFFLCLACALTLFPRASAFAQVVPDRDRDGLPDAWEQQFGLNPALGTGLDGPDGDPDNDGVPNAAEMATRSHPRGVVTRYFAEGATGTFFNARFALYNANQTIPARTLMRFLRSDGAVITYFVVIAPGARVSVDPERIDGLASANFATVVEADAVVVVDRTMSWDTTAYGSHAETGTPSPSRTWFLAEGATHSGFDLFYLLMNPGAAPASVTITFLLPTGAPIARTYVVGASSRYNVWVNREAAALAATDVSAAITSTEPIVVERAMYLNSQGRMFGAGHDSAGVTAPATSWFLAEGATGDFFDLFVLLANPGDQDATVTATYLLPDGTTLPAQYVVRAKSRRTVWVDHEDPRLADTAVSTVIEATNGVPIIVERAMWWPGPTPATWTEAHNSPGVTVTGSRWALAEGEVGGTAATSTYVLVANTSPRSGTAQVTVTYETGGTRTKLLTLPANSRTTVDVLATFPDSAGRRFGTLVESLDADPLQLVVERAMYSNAGTVGWAAGTDALGTLLPDPGPDGTMGMGLPVVTITASDGFAAEAGTDQGTFVVRRTGDLSPLVVTYAVGGSADLTDFVQGTGLVSFPSGVSAVTLNVVPVDDTLAEVPETVTLTLFSGALYQVGTSASAQAVILDDDQANVPVPATLVDAARFLTQATFGPTMGEINRVQSIGYDAWLNEQFDAPASSFLGYLDAISNQYVDEPHLQEAWVQYAIAGNDQLRQRVAHALLEILVVSDHNGLQGASVELAAYMDVLMTNAFGNFRTLLERVTLNPAMGKFLDMLKNDMEDPETGQRPNENFARELLQLFTIGLVELNPDGTPRLGPDGQPIPTYDQAVVDGFARVFTGWTFYQTTKPYRFMNAREDWRNPMIAVWQHHSQREKVLLNGVVLPAFQLPEKDLADALDNVCAHPNVGPFLGRRLIQRLVTANPSPEYVGRVAAVFANDGTGVRGNLRAVIRAILLDPEARDARTSRTAMYGKQREPMIRFINVARAFNMRATSGKFRIWDLYRDIGQSAFKAPSVFNFFQPDYQPPGLVGDLGLYAPEFQITTESGVVAMANALKTLVEGNYGPYTQDKLKPDFTRELQLAATPDARLDHLDALLFAGGMSPELRAIVRDAISSISMTSTSGPLRRVRNAVLLLVRSPEFSIQK